jgi:CRISPR-associated protein Csd2
LFEALGTMFEHDRAAARGEMTTRRLIVFKHENPLGNAPAGQLFDRVKIGRNIDGKFREIDDKGLGNMPPARKFGDYIIEVNETGLKEKGIDVLYPCEI